MRKVINHQLKLGEVDISKIEFDLRSRDEIPKILIGLQYIYNNTEIRTRVFNILKKIIPEQVDANNGCPGMDLWKILVLGTLRLICNWDFDKLHDISNNHKTLRQILGHGIFDEHQYKRQTLKDNISLFTPAVLAELNTIVAKTGQRLICKGAEITLHGRCDSFVVETNVHYPTDINLLLDATRKIFTLTSRESAAVNMSDWRQSGYNFRVIKKMYRKAQKLKRSNSKNDKKKEKREKEIIDAHQAYIDQALIHVNRAKETIRVLREKKLTEEKKLLEIEQYIDDAERQINQVERRVIKDETIAHDEKVFSLFQRHTEWISKGKAGVPQELGLKVCILSDQFGIILHHHVMEKQEDVEVTIPMIEDTRAIFSNLSSCSFDKGFYNPENKKKLANILDRVILPKKGKLTIAEKQVEHSEEFVEAKNQHSAVESAINALENHGLDRCPDHGLDGFKRYVALAVLARNIQILGHVVQQKQLKSQKHREKIKMSKSM